MSLVAPCERVAIELGDRSYAILIGAGLLDAAEVWSDTPRSAQALVVTNTTVAPLYAQRLRRAVADRHEQVHIVALPDGEEHKGWETLNRIFDELLAKACDRKTVLYALGGGVVGDMTGFAAACYMRGVPFVQVPTTLLAQVDSSVGGKTAINHPLGKNMIGAFHQPVAVVADTATLATLPPRELAAGLAEVAKYGAIHDLAFLEWIEDHAGALLQRDAAALAHVIRRSCEIKAEIVAADERESGARALLNFGHTFGHAIESAQGYGNWLHGEAVAAGMAMAARFSSRLGRLPAADAERLVKLLEKLGLPVRPPRIATDVWLGYMGRDKKNEAGRVTLILLDALGRASVVKDAPAEPLERFLAAS
jgi:3-dehydroquinate synthase